jgi:hypothetical protein
MRPNTGRCIQAGGGATLLDMVAHGQDVLVHGVPVLVSRLNRERQLWRPLKSPSLCWPRKGTGIRKMLKGARSSHVPPLDVIRTCPAHQQRSTWKDLPSRRRHVEVERLPGRRGHPSDQRPGPPERQEGRMDLFCPWTKVMGTEPPSSFPRPRDTRVGDPTPPRLQLLLGS